MLIQVNLGRNDAVLLQVVSHPFMDYPQAYSHDGGKIQRDNKKVYSVLCPRFRTDLCHFCRFPLAKVNHKDSQNSAYEEIDCISQWERL